MLLMLHLLLITELIVVLITVILTRGLVHRAGKRSIILVNIKHRLRIINLFLEVLLNSSLIYVVKLS